MADAFETIGDWVNDARNWFSERITVDDWVDGFEDWLQVEADTIFSWISQKLEWLVDALEGGLTEGEPPVVALFFVGLAFVFALGALRHPVRPMRAAMVTLVAVPVVLWAHDTETQVALIAATVALVAVMVRDDEEPLDPLLRTVLIGGPAAALVLRGNLLVEDPPSFDYPPLLIGVVTVVSLAALYLTLGRPIGEHARALALSLVVIASVVGSMLGSVPLITVLAIPMAGAVVGLLLTAWQRGTSPGEIGLTVTAGAAVVTAILTTDEVGAAVAVVAAVLTVGLTLGQWERRSFPLDGLVLALFTSVLYVWGDLELMAAISAGLMVPLVIALAVTRSNAGRPFPIQQFLVNLPKAAVGLVVVAGVSWVAKVAYDNVDLATGSDEFRLDVLRPLAATTEFWTNYEFLKTAAAVVVGLLLVVLLVWVLGVAALHATALSGVAVAGFLLDDPLFMVVALAAVAWEVRSFQFGLVAGFGFFLVNVMGLWEEAMETMSLVLVATLLAVSIGVPIGIAATQSNVVSRVTRPVLDLMQTMPALVYLIPAVVFFRLGAVPGVVSTVIFAMPPAVRLTELGIRQVDEEVVEAGEAFGTPPSRILSGIQIPLAMPTIMAGINQVIMLALSMVVLAAFVGAGGLGGLVVRGMSRQDTGLGFQAGLAVVILAIFLDRVTQALGQRTGPSASRADAA